MREEDVVSLHLPIGPLKKTLSMLEPVPRCEPSTYQSISRLHSHCAIGAVLTSEQLHVADYHRYDISLSVSLNK